MVWKRNVASFICMFPMAHLELPLCKGCFSFNSSVKAHILIKLKNCNLPPWDRSLHTGPHNLSSRTLEDNRQNLLEVTTKHYGNTTKGPIRVTPVPEGAIHCFHDVVVLHRSLIPNDQVSLAN